MQYSLGKFSISEARKEVEKDREECKTSELVSLVERIVKQVAFERRARLGKSRADVVEECVQQVCLKLWSKPGQRLRENAARASCEQAYLARAIGRWAKRLVGRFVKLGPQAIARYEPPIEFNSARLKKIIDRHEERSLQQVPPEASVEFQDFLTSVRCPADVRKYLLAKAEDRVITDEDVREANGWTRPYFEAVREQARELLRGAWPDEVGSLFAVWSTPPEDQPPTPPVIPAAWGNFTFEEMQEHFEENQQAHPGASSVFTQEEGDWFAWGPFAQELAEALKRATEPGPYLQFDCCDERVTGVIVGLLEDRERKRQAREPADPVILWSIA